MGRIVDREYIISCLNQFYLDQEKNCYFCFKMHCRYCRKVGILEHQLSIKNFNSGNSHVKLWLISYIGPNNRIVIKPFM